MQAQEGLLLRTRGRPRHCDYRTSVLLRLSYHELIGLSSIFSHFDSGAPFGFGTNKVRPKNGRPIPRGHPFTFSAKNDKMVMASPRETARHES
jgi:hypothetical protein